MELEKINEFIRENRRIKSFVVHSSPQTDCLYNESDEDNKLFFIEDSIQSPTDCQIIDPHYFNVNIELFTESQKYHTYFNRKLAIDTYGNIKNCSALDKSYGHVSTSDIYTIVTSDEFQSLWFIHKDIISICKDCEFRYMCIDAREPIKGENDVYYHLVKCPYNPYNLSWEHD